MAENSRDQRAAERAKKERQERERKRREMQQKQAKERAEKAAKENAQKQADKPENDWSSEAGKLLTSGGSKLGKAADAVTDVLVDKEAWGDIFTGKADKRDWANAALDATMLIPGVGLAGGLARGGARAALKMGAKEAGEAAAPKLTGLAAQVAERNAAKAGHRAGTQAAEAAGRHRGAAGLGTRSTVGGKRSKKAGESTLAGRLLNEGVSVGREGLEGLATRQTRALAGDKSARILAGKGTRVGFNQTKRRVVGNALAAGGLNAAMSGVNALLNAGRDNDPTGIDDDGILEVPGGGAGGVTGYYFVDAAGEATSIPESAAKAIGAGYVNKGGSPDGSQVIFLGR